MLASVGFFELDQDILCVQRLVDNADPLPDFTTTGLSTVDNSGSFANDPLSASGGSAGTTATWQFFMPIAGIYDIDVYLPGASGNGQAHYMVSTTNGPATVIVNQTGGSARWETILSASLSEGWQTAVLDADASTGLTGFADAVRIKTEFIDLIPGDSDQGGDVDFTDAMNLRFNFSRPINPGDAPIGFWQHGDFDLDGDTDLADSDILSANFTGRRDPAPAPQLPTDEAVEPIATTVVTMPILPPQPLRESIRLKDDPVSVYSKTNPVRKILRPILKDFIR
jgi:hypothetical protein